MPRLFATFSESILFVVVFPCTVFGLLLGCSQQRQRPHVQIGDSRDLASEQILAQGEYVRDAAAFAQPVPTAILAFPDESGALGGSVTLGAMDIDVISYDLSGSFDWDTRLLKARVVIELQVRSDGGDAIILDSAVKVIEGVSLLTGVGTLAVPFVIDRDGGKLVLAKWDLPEDAQRAGGILRLAIDYTAASNTTPPELAGPQKRSTLHAVSGRVDDPVQSRVFYTTAEPLGASTWMPCNNVPSDRAVFRSSFQMPVQEKLIANGRLESDVVDSLSNRRIMTYGTEYSLPTYLMAFAVGEFQVNAIQYGSLPLSVWSRRGLGFDGTAVLDSLAVMMAKFEELLIPYPFEKYALVLLPQFPSGGIEHASISFQAEDRSTEALHRSDYSLTAHELAHQWFGDYVTVATWDDLWIKEGMATLLAAEAVQRFEDRDHLGFLPGASLRFVAGEAMRDASLPPNQKYTSGPYGRAAWYFNQLRAVVGESAFWGVMRGILLSTPFGVIGTEDILEAFEPLLSLEQASVARKAVDNKAAPRFIERELSFALEDEGSSLIAPLEFRFLTSGGSEDVRLVRGGGVLPKTLLDDASVLPVFDPRGVHPSAFAMVGGASMLFEVHRKLSLDEFERIVSLGPVAAVRTFAIPQQLILPAAPMPTDLDRVRRLFGVVGSDSAALLFVERLCGSLESENLDWQRFGHELFGMVSYRGQGVSEPGLQGCMSTEWRVALEAELSKASRSQGQGKSALELAALRFLLRGQSDPVPHWGNLATEASSLRSRGLAIGALSDGLGDEAQAGLLPPGSQRRTIWAKVINQVVGEAAVTENIRMALDLAGAYARLDVAPTAFARETAAAGDLESNTQSAAQDLLPGFTVLFSKSLPSAWGERALCLSLPVLGEELWKKLLTALSGGPNGPAAESLGQDPAPCGV
jgi:hypothetical protein